MKLQDKHILLAGASGGIGQAIAGHLAAAGAKLILLGRNGQKLLDLRASLPGEHRITIADLNCSSDRQEIVKECRKSGLDVFINAAGVMDFMIYAQQDSERIEQMISTNLLSPMLLCHSLLPLLMVRPEAAIVNIGSIFGSIGHPGFTGYCASKFGLRGFTEALQRELADGPVRVLYLAPRATSTDLNSRAVTALNEALGNTSDAPEKVALELMSALSARRLQSYMGWPEKFFVRLNGAFPSLVHRALVKKLPVVHHHSKPDSRS